MDIISQCRLCRELGPRDGIYRRILEIVTVGWGLKLKFIIDWLSKVI